MGICIEGYGDRRMSEAFRDGFGVYTLLEHQAGVRVPEIVKPDSRESYLACLTPKSLAEGVWAQRGTVNHMAEHQGPSVSSIPNKAASRSWDSRWDRNTKQEAGESATAIFSLFLCGEVAW